MPLRTLPRSKNFYRAPVNVAYRQVTSLSSIFGGFKYPLNPKLIGRNLDDSNSGSSGSGSSSMTPASLSNIVAWWKADSFSLADNTTIGGAGLEWQDQTASNNDGVTGSGACKYRTLGIGGAFPSIEFTGSSLAISDITLNGDFTIIAVAETIGDTPWFGNSVTNIQIRRKRSGVNNLSFFPGAAPEVISDNFATSDNANVLMVWRRSGTTVSFRENKTNRNSGTNGGGFTLNQIGLSAFVGSATGDLSEAVIYSDFKSDSELDLLYDSYFKSRTSLP